MVAYGRARGSSCVGLTIVGVSDAHGAGPVEQMKPIRLSGHAREQLGYRGTTEAEIAEAVRTSPWQPAALGRLECRKNFAYDDVWNKKRYRTKQVRPIFAEEASEIIVITVYTYFSEGD